MRIRTGLGVLVIVMTTLRAYGDVRLAGVFGDHMVLQCDRKLPIWGWADAGENVVVSATTSGGVVLGSAKGQAGADGRWRVDLPALKSGALPIELNVAGDKTIKIVDVLVGEVWVCSGQSNMEYSLRGANNGRAVAAAADEPELRYCIVGQDPEAEPVADRRLKWVVCSPLTAGKLSAVGYFFGRELHDNLHVPVGLVESAVAGTVGQAWANIGALQSAPELKHYVDDVNDVRGKISAATEPAKFNAGTPTSLYNGMIAPLIPFSIRGVVWYQGESNTDKAVEYRALFPALITGWRGQWGEGDFPFLFVQLPGFRERDTEPGKSDWAMLREAQASALGLGNVGMAVTIDLALPREILHPKEKAAVGQRLALLARKLVYGQDVVARGPVMESVKRQGDGFRIRFRETAGGLMIGDTNARAATRPAATLPATLLGFTIAGADHHFVYADAEIDGDTVVVRSDQVKEPVAVRYGWGENPAVNLCNKGGVPAGPFRSDDWGE